MATIGTKIRKLRELKDFKQEDMALKLGITTGAYSKMEREETDITHERLKQIAEIFNLSVVELLSFDEKNIFNNINNTANSAIYGNSYNIFSEEMKKLYEDRNNLQEDKIKYLEEKIETLKKEIDIFRVEKY